MQQILAITRKEISLWAKKPGSWILVFIVPFIFIWIMQAVFGGSGTPVVTVFAVNEDKGREAARVMDTLRLANNLKIEELKTRDEADRRVGAGERMAAVVIPEGFSDALTTQAGAKVEILVDPARSEQANIVIGLVNSALAPVIVDAEVSRGVEMGVAKIMQTSEATPGPTDNATGSGLDGTPTPGATEDNFGLDLTALPGDNQSAGGPVNTPSPDTLTRFFTAAMKGVVSSQVQDALDNPQVQLNEQPDPLVKTAHQPSLLDSLVPGYSLMFVFFLIPNLAMTVIEERQTGTLRRLLVSPVTRSQILLGKMLPYFLIAAAQMTLVLLVSQFAFGIDLGRAWLALSIIIITSALAMSALGILIAAFSQSEGQADGLAVVIVLALAVISGAMFPTIFIPGLQNITPHYWAMQGFLNVIARGQGVEGVLGPAGVLLTMSAVMFTVGAVRFRFE